jgi:outer membrane protein TolC
MRKRHILPLFLCFTLMSFSVASLGQRTELSLKEAYMLMDAQYPLLKSAELVAEIGEKEITRVSKNALPSISLKGDAKYQSETPHLDLPQGAVLPFEIDLPLYSAKSYLELNYFLYDGGLVKAQKNTMRIQNQIEIQNIEVERYKLKDRINQLFLNINFLELQAELLTNSKNTLTAQKNRIKAGVEEGAVLPSELGRITVKELELSSLKSNVEYKRNELLFTLSYFLGVDLSDSINLIIPAYSISELDVIRRPELMVLSKQKEALEVSKDFYSAMRKPKVAAFAQGGYGYPNPLNFFDNTTSSYGIIGLQLKWNLIDWGTTKTDQEILSLKQGILQNKEETLLYNISSEESTFISEVERLNQLMINDDKIIKLQAEILEQTSSQLEEEVVTVSEYTAQFNTLLTAKQNKLIHQIELQKLQLNFLNNRGN